MLVSLMPRPPVFYFLIIACRDVVFADASIQRDGYVMRYMYQKAASDFDVVTKASLDLPRDYNGDVKQGPSNRTAQRRRRGQERKRG
jgi:hypothetical protein